MYNNNYSEIDWALADQEIGEDTVLETYSIGDKVQLPDGSIGYVNTNRMSNNMYNIIGPYRLWTKNHIDGDDLILIQEVNIDKHAIGDPVVKSSVCRIPNMKSNRRLGYIVETSNCRGSTLSDEVVSVMFDDSEVHTIRLAGLIKTHEITIPGKKSDKVYSEHIDNLIDKIGTFFSNGEILKVKSAEDKVTSYHMVVHNDKFRTLTEVYISNGFSE
jgi:hypothetical protein